MKTQTDFLQQYPLFNLRIDLKYPDSKKAIQDLGLQVLDLIDVQEFYDRLKFNEIREVNVLDGQITPLDIEGDTLMPEHENCPTYKLSDLYQEFKQQNGLSPAQDFDPETIQWGTDQVQPLGHRYR